MGYIEDRANVQGKVAMIPGGGGGIGRAIALEYARAGLHLALCDRDATLLDETVAACREAGASVVAATLDARQPEPLVQFLESAHAELGRLDVLVNVVGGTFRQPFADSTPNGWDALIRANFTWLLHPTHWAIRTMRAAGSGGSIINITSIEAHRAAPNFAVYAAMKAGVTSLSRTLAVELARDRIRVNTIAPDKVPTERQQAMTPEERVAGVWGDDEVSRLGATVGIPMGRIGTYDDVGAAALFLASDLSSYVTGTSLHPDGGVIASSGWWNWPDTGFHNFPPPAVTERLLPNP